MRTSNLPNINKMHANIPPPETACSPSKALWLAWFHKKAINREHANTAVEPILAARGTSSLKKN